MSDMEKELKATEAFKSWADSIGLSCKPDQHLPVHIEENRPSPLAASEVHVNVPTADMFADFLLNTVHFDGHHGLL